MSKLFLVLLPIIVISSNYFTVNNLPQGVLSLFITLYLLMLIFKGESTAFKNKKQLSLFFLLGAYTFISSLIVVFNSFESELISVVVPIINFIPFIWVMLSKNYYREDLTNNSITFAKSVFTISVLYVSIALPVLASEGSRGWAIISIEYLPNRNDVSIFFLVGFSAFVFLDSKLSKIKKQLVLGVILISILLTFSRSAYASLFFLVIYLIFTNEHRFKYLFLFLGVFSLLYFIDNPISDRFLYTFESGSTGQYDDSTSLRIIIWGSALDNFLNNPILGVGAGVTPFVNTDYFIPLGSSILYAHNYYITQLYQLGIIGFLLTLSVFISFYSLTKFVNEDERKFSVSILIIFLVSSLSGEPLYGFSKMIFMFTYLSLLTVRLRY